MKAKYIPNILSVIRLLLVPIFVYYYLINEHYIAVSIFILAGLTDVVDGYIARRFDFMSNVGKILDPIADKVLQMAAFICLAISETVPIWMPIVYFIKESGTLLGALFVFRKSKIVVKSNIFGKLATFFVFAFVSTIIAFPNSLNDTAIAIICALICLYFVFSCLMYVKLEVRPEVKKGK